MDCGIASKTSSAALKYLRNRGPSLASFLYCQVTPNTLSYLAYFTLVDNTIGTNPDGTILTSYNDAAAISIEGYFHQIGLPGQGNIISGTFAGLELTEYCQLACFPNLNGLSLRGFSVSEVQSNWIGTNPSGASLGGEFGIIARHSVHSIGADASEDDPLVVAEKGNVIANQSKAGILVRDMKIEFDPSAASGYGASSRGNIFTGVPADIPILLEVSTPFSFWVFDDGGYDHIDCSGVSCFLPNDVGDSDDGQNNLQNYPEFDGAVTQFNESTGELEVRYRVDSDPANSDYPLQIDFYLATKQFNGVDIYLGSDTYLESDAGLFRSVAFPPVDPATEVAGYLRATATARYSNDPPSFDYVGNTSQMSEQLITVPEPGVGVGVFAGALGLVGLAGRPRRINRLL